MRPSSPVLLAFRPTTAGHGTRYVFGAYDVHGDRLLVRLRPRRRGSVAIRAYAGKHNKSRLRP